MQMRSFKSEQRSRAGAGITVTLLLALALLKIDAAAGRPDVRQSPFSLELQPPLLEAAADDAFKAGGDRTIDSYGNPIDALRPIDTPDGRKVVSAQGLQFEIPNYASGITAIRKPADDLLPPHIAPAKTSTTPAVPVEPNPFNSATLPPWLQDFDYPDVGPGVPYNPDNFKETPVASGQKPGGTKPNDFQPQGLPARFDTPASGQETQISAQSLTPTATPLGTATAEEQFPPFNGNAADSPKVEYTKSEEGKVISTPVNTLRKDAQENNVFQASTAASPAAASNTGKYTGGFGAPAGLLRPQSAAKPDIYVAGNEHEFSTNVKANKVRPGAVANANGGRYTGGFGAPSGVLSPQNAPRPFQQSQQPQPQPQLVSAATSHHQNRFGGPPGVLVPYDNVPRAGGQ
ncbi:uncharacterized protein Dvir_GJ20491, isoform C [Drosophila virilis]|uniref:Uncharacterized protein, isoform C n=1 Tax=Drosophila virilis TaxID=7244 RepID=A0A0Q9W3X9_DROVI|nr:YLP motif-containing protein 1 isoform X4 [Drosophila virilis]KRF79772.1 uncharacterized protein Dvir_GJ20491, isoform C [Drosophila virilis]